MKEYSQLVLAACSIILMFESLVNPKSFNDVLHLSSLAPASLFTEVNSLLASHPLEITVLIGLPILVIIIIISSQTGATKTKLKNDAYTNKIKEPIDLDEK